MYSYCYASQSNSSWEEAGRHTANKIMKVACKDTEPNKKRKASVID